MGRDLVYRGLTLDNCIRRKEIRMRITVAALAFLLGLGVNGAMAQDGQPLPPTRINTELIKKPAELQTMFYLWVEFCRSHPAWKLNPATGQPVPKIVGRDANGYLVDGFETKAPDVNGNQEMEWDEESCFMYREPYPFSDGVAMQIPSKDRPVEVGVAVPSYCGRMAFIRQSNVPGYELRRQGGLCGKDPGPEEGTVAESPRKYLLGKMP